MAKKKMAVGSAWDLGSGKKVEITKPNGETVTVIGGVYILSEPGEYTSGDQTVVVAE